MKTCSKCKETKPLESFGKDKHNKDGLRYICKECMSKRAKSKWANLTDEQKKSNYDRVNKWRNSQDEDKKEALRSVFRVKNMTEEQQERRRIQAAESRSRRPEQVLINAARTRAKRNGIDFNITKEDISIPEVCPVLGIPLVKGEKFFTDNSPTIDRIDNSKGYVRGNIEVISYKANSIKGHGSIEDLEMILEYMKRNQ